jgi:hypothetical protein
VRTRHSVSGVSAELTRTTTGKPAATAGAAAAALAAGPGGRALVR